MSRINSISGPCIEEVWEKVSKEIGADININSRGIKINKKYDGTDIVLEYYTMDAGSIPITYTRIKSNFKSLNNFKFKICNRNELNSKCNELDIEEYSTENAIIDNELIIKTNEKEIVKKIVKDKNIINVLMKYRNFIFQCNQCDKIDKNQGMFNFEVSFRTLGIIKNGIELKEMYSLICNTINILNEENIII